MLPVVEWRTMVRKGSTKETSEMGIEKLMTWAQWWRGACAAGALLVVTGGWQGGGTGLVTSEVLGQEVPSIWDGVYTEAQATRGAEVYQASCAFCHGEDLMGNEMGPGLAGSGFLQYWSGLSLADLRNVMVTSMPQDNPGGLEPSQYADVLAYLLQKSEFPAGSVEVPEDGAGLEGVQIETQPEQ